MSRPRTKPGSTGRSLAGRWFSAHWGAVAVIVLILVLGVPVLHALLGDMVAILLLIFLGGFALGRATANRKR